MIALDGFLDLGILWFLIVLFTGSLDAEHSYRETWIVIIGLMIIHLAARAVVGDDLQLLALPIQWVGLYYLVDWACETDRRTTLKICGWYAGSSLVIGLVVFGLRGE